MSPDVVTSDKRFPSYHLYPQLNTSSQLTNLIGSGPWGDLLAVPAINKTTFQLLMPLHGLFTDRFHCSEKRLQDYNAVYTGTTLSFAKPVYIPYFTQTEHGVFSAQQLINQCYETGPTVDQTHPRRLQSLTICKFQYNDSTFYSVIIVIRESIK